MIFAHSLISRTFVERYYSNHYAQSLVIKIRNRAFCLVSRHIVSNRDTMNLECIICNKLYQMILICILLILRLLVLYLPFEVITNIMDRLEYLAEIVNNCHLLNLKKMVYREVNSKCLCIFFLYFLSSESSICYYILHSKSK